MSISALLDTSSAVVIDTCVLADAIIAGRPRHTVAVAACKILQVQGRVALVPAHSFFELTSVVFAEHHKRQQPLRLGEFGKNFPVQMNIVDINLQFIETHLFPSLAEGSNINASGGDMIFLALALRQFCPIITEDAKLSSRAKSLNILTYTCEEYIKA